MGQPTRREKSSDDNNSSRTSDLRVLLDENASIWLSLTWVAVPIACLLLAGVSVFLLLSERRTVHQQDILAEQTPPLQAAASTERTEPNLPSAADLTESVNRSIREALKEPEVSRLLKPVVQGLTDSIAKVITDKLAQNEAEKKEAVDKTNALQQKNSELNTELENANRRVKSLEERLNDDQAFSQQAGNVKERILAAREKLGADKELSKLIEEFDRTVERDAVLPEDSLATSVLLKTFLRKIVASTTDAINDEQGGLRRSFESSLERVAERLDLLAAERFPVEDGRSESLLILLPCTVTNKFVCAETLYPIVRKMDAEFRHWESVIPEFSVDCAIGQGATQVNFREKGVLGSEPAFSGESKSEPVVISDKITRCLLVLGSLPNDWNPDFPLPEGVPIDVILVIKGASVDVWNDDVRKRTEAALAAWHGKLASRASSGSSLSVVCLNEDSADLTAEIRRRLMPAMLRFDVNPEAE